MPISPYGYLNDYIPFYFTPFSPMLHNIKSGSGVTCRANSEIIVLVSSLKKIQALNIPFIFTDMHALFSWTTFYSELDDLDKIDWSLIQKRDFKRDTNDPQKFERYQAEALIHHFCPISALSGIVCYDENCKQFLDNYLNQKNIELNVIVKSGWYF